MSDITTWTIWQAETGITDLEGDATKLGASEIPGIKAIWEDQRKRLAGTAQLADFTEKLSREWAIETGIIENLYDIDRGVTQTLIEHGFQAELLSHGSTNKPREHVVRLLRDQKEALRLLPYRGAGSPARPVRRLARDRPENRARRLDQKSLIHAIERSKSEGARGKSFPPTLTL